MRLLTTTALVLAAAPALAEDVSYDVDGVAHTGYYASSQTGESNGLVLIVHDWDGMGDYEKKRADMIATLGYDAFALDMFGADTSAETVDERRAATGELYEDREKMRALIRAGLEQARGQSDAEAMVAMGYCFGGAVTLEMARSDMASEAAGFASFHGGLSTPEGQGWDGDEPPLLIAHGGADEAVPFEELVGLMQELEESGNAYTAEVYSGAPHAFSVFGSDRYVETADVESWDAFEAFLSRNL